MDGPKFHVIQIATDDPHAVEIIKSFPTREEALRVAEKARQEDRTNYFEYMVSGNPDDLIVSKERAGSEPA